MGKKLCATVTLENKDFYILCNNGSNKMKTVVSLLKIC